MAGNNGITYYLVDKNGARKPCEDPAKLGMRWSGNVQITHSLQPGQAFGPLHFEPIARDTDPKFAAEIEKRRAAIRADRSNVGLYVS